MSLLKRRRRQKKKKAAEKKEEEEEEEEEAEELKGDDLDIFAVDDINDVGNGEPLFVDFTFEDWTLLSLRYELFLLVQAFMHDVDDEERKGVHETNLAFYYNKYYHKQLTPKHYGKDTNQALIDMVKDTASIDKDSSVLNSNLESDVSGLDIFVKLTEEARRERQRRLDAGDETVRIKFNPMVNQVSKPAPAAVGGVKAAPGMVRPAGQPAWAVRPAGPATWRPAYAAGAKGAWGGAW